MIIYVCDGSHSGGMMGAGILRIEQLGVEQFHFTKKCKLNANIHEVFSILKTLDLIEENRDYYSTIYNDCKMTLSAFYSTKKYGVHENKEKINPLIAKIEQLESKGFSIELKHTSDLGNKNYLNIAHHLSRLYMNKKTIKGKVHLDLDNKTSFPIDVRKYPNIHFIQSDDSIFKENIKRCLFVPSFPDLNQRGFLISNDFIIPNKLRFQKISKKTWVVFTENFEPVYLGNLVDSSYQVIKRFSEQDGEEILTVNGQFVSYYLSFCQSEPQLTRPMFVNIEFVLSFINNCFLATYEDDLIDL